MITCSRSRRRSRGRRKAAGGGSRRDRGQASRSAGEPHDKVKGESRLAFECRLSMESSPTTVRSICDPWCVHVSVCVCVTVGNISHCNVRATQHGVPWQAVDSLLPLSLRILSCSLSLSFSLLLVCKLIFLPWHLLACTSLAALTLTLNASVVCFFL